MGGGGGGGRESHISSTQLWDVVICIFMHQLLEAGQEGGGHYAINHRCLSEVTLKTHPHLSTHPQTWSLLAQSVVDTT